MKETCLFCGAQEIFPYALNLHDQRQMENKTHDFFKCQRCGSLRLVPLPDEEHLAQSYPPEYQFKRESRGWLRKAWNQFEWRLFYQPALQYSTKLALRETELSSGKVLDLGCGNGLRLLEFFKAGYETEGLDFASASLRYAKDILGLRVREENLEKTNLPANHYHLLIAYCVLEHLYRPADLVRKIRDSLASEGWAMFMVPLADSWVSFLFRSFWAQIREAPRHISVPTSRGMEHLLGKNGFKNIKILPASTLELAADIGLTLWSRGHFSRTVGEWAFLKILDRALAGFITLTAIPLVALLRTMGFKQGLTIFFAQKKIERERETGSLLS